MEKLTGRKRKKRLLSMVGFVEFDKMGSVGGKNKTKQKTRRKKKKKKRTVSKNPL